jgi:crossover junction endodeoxyribonuclease RuvC
VAITIKQKPKGEVVTLAVDPSTKCGYAVTVGDRLELSGEIKTPKGKTGIPRALWLADQIEELIARHKVTRAVIEGYSFASNFNQATMVELGTILRLRLMQCGLDYLEVPPTSLKKFVSGKGNAKKDMMLLSVFQRFGVSCATDNEADAVGLAFFARAYDGANLGLPQVNMEAVHALHKEKICN